METKDKWFLTCKEATFFSGLQEEGKLSPILRMRLSFHLFSCGPCKRFVQQTRQIARKLKKFNKQNEGTGIPGLSSEEKASMQDEINRKYGGNQR